MTNNIFCKIFSIIQVFQQIRNHHKFCFFVTIFKKIITSLGFIKFIAEFNLKFWLQIRKKGLLFWKTFLINIFKNAGRHLFCRWIPSRCKKTPCPNSHNVYCCSHIHSPWMGDIVDYRVVVPACQPMYSTLACRHDNSMPESTLSPSQGLWILYRL